MLHVGVFNETKVVKGLPKVKCNAACIGHGVYRKISEQFCGLCIFEGSYIRGAIVPVVAVTDIIAATS